MKKRKKAGKTADGRVIVESNAYGEHTRAKRGTHKEAKLNDRMKTSSVALTKANEDGKLIKSALEPYFFKPSPRLFWQRLLSVVRGSYDNNHQLRPEKFVGFDVYDEYRITRLFSPQYMIDGSQQSINATIRWDMAPDFKRKFPDGYMVAVVGIWIDAANNRWESAVKYSEAFPLSVNSGNCDFTFDNPINSGFVLFFIKMNATEKKTFCKGAAASGFRCMWGKRLEDLANDRIELVSAPTDELGEGLSLL